MCSISYSNLSIQPSSSFRITSIRRSTHLVAECDLYLVPFLRTISDSAAVVTPPMALVVKIRLTSLLTSLFILFILLSTRMIDLECIQLASHLLKYV